MGAAAAHISDADDAALSGVPQARIGSEIRGAAQQHQLPARRRNGDTEQPLRLALLRRQALRIRFYQVLPGVRAAGEVWRQTAGKFSDLIHNGELTRSDAIAELQKPAYDAVALEADRTYVLKKLGFLPMSSPRT